MRGQTQALTTVLITTVIIGAIATAYVWGTPLLEKRSSQADLETAESNILDLHSSIIEASKSGEGTSTSVQLSIPDGNIEVDPAEDIIEISVNTESSPYPANTWVLIRGQNLQNLTIGRGSYAIRNQDLPGVVAVKSSGGGSNIIRYRIEFRNLKDTSTNKLHKIDLQTTGRTEGSGDVKLLLSNEGTTTDPSVTTVSGENLERERTVIDVDLQ